MKLESIVVWILLICLAIDKNENGLLCEAQTVTFLQGPPAPSFLVGGMSEMTQANFYWSAFAINNTAVGVTQYTRSSVFSTFQPRFTTVLTSATKFDTNINQLIPFCAIPAGNNSAHLYIGFPRDQGNGQGQVCKYIQSTLAITLSGCINVQATNAF